RSGAAAGGLAGEFHAWDRFELDAVADGVREHPDEKRPGAIDPGDRQRAARTAAGALARRTRLVTRLDERSQESLGVRMDPLEPLARVLDPDDPRAHAPAPAP